jgi:hypothetical protein
MIAISGALAVPAEAQIISEPIGPSGGPIIGAIVGTAASVVVATVVVIHYSKKRAITGCVISGESGMTLTDEKTSIFTRSPATRQILSRAIE